MVKLFRAPMTGGCSAVFTVTLWLVVFWFFLPFKYLTTSVPAVLNGELGSVLLVSQTSS